MKTGVDGSSYVQCQSAVRFAMFPRV